MSVSRTPKLMNYINYRIYLHLKEQISESELGMRLTLTDSRYIIGRFMAFDRHMNVVLGDSEEYRLLPPKKGREEREERRVLGLVLVRGEEVISLTIEGPPPQEESRLDKAKLAAVGPGIGRAAGRGLPVPVPVPVPGQAPGVHLGLAAAARGVGGPAPGVMLPRPQVQAPPLMHPPPLVRPGVPPTPMANLSSMPGMPPPAASPGQMPPVGMPPPPAMGMNPPGGFPPPQFRPGMPPPAVPHPGTRPSMPPPQYPPPSMPPPRPQ